MGAQGCPDGGVIGDPMWCCGFAASRQPQCGRYTAIDRTERRLGRGGGGRDQSLQMPCVA